jgi:hypothetical protein
MFYKYFTIPGIGQLAGGLPNNYYFPFDTLEAKVARPARWKPTPNDPIDPPPDDEEANAQLSLKDGKKKAKAESSPLNQQCRTPATKTIPSRRSTSLPLCSMAKLKATHRCTTSFAKLREIICIPTVHIKVARR